MLFWNAQKHQKCSVSLSADNFIYVLLARPIPSTPGRLPLSCGSLLFRVWVVPRKRKSVSRCLTHGRIYGNLKLYLISKASCENIFFLLTFSFYQRKSKCNYKAFVAISSIIFLMNSSTGTAPMSPFFLERTATAPASISLSPITSI